MSAPKSKRRGERDETTLAFDVTQDIDPALVDPMWGPNEPTLTQADFDDLSVDAPKPRSPKR
jgi:hypothetical protein